VILFSEVMVTVSIMWERDECSFMLVQDWDLFRSDTAKRSITSALVVTGIWVRPGTKLPCGPCLTCSLSPIE
jgi:hypothetical protein